MQAATIHPALSGTGRTVFPRGIPAGTIVAYQTNIGPPAKRHWQARCPNFHELAKTFDQIAASPYMTAKYVVRVYLK